MATDFGTIDDTFVDHNTIHTLRTYSEGRGAAPRPSDSSRSLPPRTVGASSVRDYDDSRLDLGDCDSIEGVPTARKVGQCLELLRDVAEEWKQQNSFSADGDHKEVMQRQIETLHAIRRNYIDELVYFLEMTQNTLTQKENSADSDE